MATEIGLDNGTAYDVTESVYDITKSVDEVREKLTNGNFLLLTLYSKDGDNWDGRPFYVRAESICTITLSLDDDD